MIRALINIYILVLILDIILSYLPDLRHKVWARRINQMAGVTLNPIRKYLPPDMPFDFSPVIVIILLRLVMALW